MEPARPTAADLLTVQAELAALEPIFHHPELGTTRAHYEAMTDPDFWEVGASGKRYSREQVIQTLIDRHARPGEHEERWAKEGLHCQRLAADLYLLSYTLTEQGPRTTRRTTLWRRVPGGWKIVYHQGTLVQPA